MMSCETYHFLIHHDTTRSLINKLVVSKDTFVTVLMFLILALLMPRGETLIPTIVTFKAPSLLLLATTTLAQLLHCFLDVEDSRLYQAKDQVIIVRHVFSRCSKMQA